MPTEQDLEQKLTDYSMLAHEDPNIDVAALAMSALQNEDQNQLSPKLKRWGYVLSLAAPPLGLLFAAWFFMSDKTDSKRAAVVCLVLTAVAILLLILTAKLFFSSAGVSVKQVEQIKPQDVYQLTQ